MSIRNELALLTRGDLDHEATIRKAVALLDKQRRLLNQLVAMDERGCFAMETPDDHIELVEIINKAKAIAS